MARARLTIDLDAIVANWRALAALSGPGTETAAVVKSDAYGLGAWQVAPALLQAGAKTFFVANAEEGTALREHIGPQARIFVLSGCHKTDTKAVSDGNLVPVLCSLQQVRDFRQHLPAHPAALQVDIGMNRLGLKPAELAQVLPLLPALNLQLVMGHLSCSDEALHPLNPAQLAAFHAMTGLLALYPRSLSATGGILLGSPYHFALTRPGIGLYGGLPFAGAMPVVSLSAPVLQVRDLLPGETVGYGAAFVAPKPMKIAAIAAGYGDGLPRSLAGKGRFYAEGSPCPIVGRVSMDLITLDVSHLAEVPDQIEILGPNQSIDQLAAAAGTIGYEILTSLGTRYERHYKGG